MLDDLDGLRFSFYVISAAPEEVIQSALEGIVPVGHIFGTRFQYDSPSGEIQSIVRVPHGFVLQERDKVRTDSVTIRETGTVSQVIV